MDNKLLDLFTEFYEKQDIAQKLTAKMPLHDYGYSELHSIDAIGNGESVNVTFLSQKLGITRGAASKIAKRLMAAGTVYSYRNDGNKKAIYFGLTAKGRAVFLEHQQRHQLWKMRDKAFLESVSTADKQIVCRFLESFNRYLEKKITESEQAG